MKQLCLVIFACIWFTACNTSEGNAVITKPDKPAKKISKKQTNEQENAEALNAENSTPLDEADNLTESNSNTPEDAQNTPENMGTGTTAETTSANTIKQKPATTPQTEPATYFTEVPATDLRATSSREPSVKSKTNKAVMSFEAVEYDFGTIVTGSKIVHDFKFTNTGSAPLIIHDASSTCGCTIPEVPLEPIAPGETGVVKVRFDSAGKIGSQNKTVTIQTNGSPATYHIYLKGLALTENMMKEETPEPDKE